MFKFLSVFLFLFLFCENGLCESLHIEWQYEDNPEKFVLNNYKNEEIKQFLGTERTGDFDYTQLNECEGFSLYAVNLEGNFSPISDIYTFCKAKNIPAKVGTFLITINQVE